MGRRDLFCSDFGVNYDRNLAKHGTKTKPWDE
jgi:hypothetical protein